MKCLTCSCSSCDSPNHATGMSNANWCPQSAEETVTFTDRLEAEIGWKIGTDDLAVGDEDSSASLQEYLSRPVKIATRLWNISDAAYTKVTVYPWSAYLMNTRVQKKLANFAYIRGNLKIRVLTNASPFYYGAMRVCYQPLPTLKPDTILSTGLQACIPYSQRTGFMIRPGQNEAYEMTLPFFYQANKFDLTGVLTGGNANELGKLDYVIYAALQSANSVAAAGVTVDTYAWLEDVELSSYTVVPQSSEVDEYGEGVVSKPATALAAMASTVKDVPGIGKFATATEIGARAIAHIARLFGYTNVPVVADAMPFRSEPFPHMAATDIGYPVEKLTVDSKAELSVHPSALGLPVTDELAVVNLVSRESFITSVPWSTTNLEDDLLFSAKVTPLNYSSTGDTVNTQIDMTPAAMVACLYKHWRGDLIYRFDVIASPYHKGRLIVSHDPTGTSGVNIMNTTTTTNAVNTHIIDLAETTSFELRVPYQQPTSYVLTRAGVNSTFLTASAKPWTVGGATSVLSQGDINGYITLRVQTVLTAPVAVAPVNVLVSVRGADNLEFANPSNPPVYLSTFTAQSGEFDEAHQADTSTLGNTVSTQMTQRTRMHFGESVACLRPLLRRMCYHSSVPASSNGNNYTGGDWILQYRFRRLPTMFGYDPNGIFLATGLVTPASSFPFNYANMTPLTWVMPAFVAYRGSMNWSFDITSAGKLLSNVSVVRDNNNTNGAGIGFYNVTSTATASTRAQLYGRRSRGTVCGTTLTNMNTQSGVNVSVPNMTQYRFQTTDFATANAGSVLDGSLQEACALEVKESNSINPFEINIESYVGAGADFNLHYFLNVPTWLNYGSYPTAP